MMNSIEKLRDYINDLGAELDSLQSVVIDLIADVEREIAELYMKVPVDADGVPIHVGDVLESTNAFKNRCVVMGIGDATKHDHIIYVKFEAAGDISQTWASKFIHRKPDAERGERKAVRR